MKILKETRLDATDDDEAVTDQVIYFDNGCVTRQRKNIKGKVTRSEILVRLVYTDKDLERVLLETIKTYVGG